MQRSLRLLLGLVAVTSGPACALSEAPDTAFDGTWVKRYRLVLPGEVER